MAATTLSSGRRVIGLVVASVAAASLLTGCFERDFGRGELADINDDGRAVGRLIDDDGSGNEATRVVAVDTATGAEQVLHLPSGWSLPDVLPVGIADDGTVYGNAADESGSVGVRWTPATGEVEVLPDAGFELVLVNTVSDGGIAGGLGRGGGVEAPLLWIGDDVVDLSALPGAPVQVQGDAWVTAVNDHRQVVGRAWYGGDYFQFTWDPTSGFRLRPGSDISLGAVNDDGVVVGSFTEAGIQRPAWYDWATLTPHVIDDRGSASGVNDSGMAVGQVWRPDGKGSQQLIPACIELSTGELSELSRSADERAVTLNDAGAVVGIGHGRAGMWNPGSCVPSSG